MSDELATLKESVEHLAMLSEGKCVCRELRELAFPATDDAEELADEKWIKTIAHTRCNHIYVIDGVSNQFYVRFDCTPTDEGHVGATVLIHPPADNWERGIVVKDNATRRDVRQFLAFLGIELTKKRAEGTK